MADDIEKELGLSDMGGAGILELARQLGVQFGGTKGLAKKLRMMWDDPDTPAATKHSIMSLVAKTYSQAAEADSKANFESMSREELVLYIRRLMKKHDDKFPESLEKPQP
jgi:hypothetical protein